MEDGSGAVGAEAESGYSKVWQLSFKLGKDPAAKGQSLSFPFVSSPGHSSQSRHLKATQIQHWKQRQFLRD